ncbi:MAG TPA: hypothetical protein VFZ85_05770 [Jiangellaceae bacterium]
MSNDEPSGTKEQAKQTAGNAAEAGRHVGGVAKDEARQVATDARQQARNLLGEAKTQVEDQSRTQRDRLVSNLRTFTDDLEQMAGQTDNSGMANQLVQQVASTARSVTDKLDQREPSEMLDEVRRFARRRPGAFLLSAFAAGVVAGRVARGAKDAGSEEPTDTTRTTEMRGVPDARGGAGLPPAAQRPGDPSPAGVAPATGTTYPSQGPGYADPQSVGGGRYAAGQNRRGTT